LDALSSLSGKNLTGEETRKATSKLLSKHDVPARSILPGITTESAQKPKTDIHTNLTTFRHECTSQFQLDKESINLANLFRKNLLDGDKELESPLCPKLIEVLSYEDILTKSTHHHLLKRILTAFCLILEEDQADDEDDIDWDKLVKKQNVICKLGITKLIINIVANCKSDLVFKVVLKLAIALLFGGNPTVQANFLDNFQSFQKKSESFFLELRHRLRRGITEIEDTKQFYLKHIQIIISTGEEHHQDIIKTIPNTGSFISENLYQLVNDFIVHEKDDKYEASSSISEILRFLQLFCEGHNFQLQNYLRLQPNQGESYDLVSEPALGFLETLEREIDATNIDIAIQLFVTLTEYCQGPCPANQIALVLHTKLCDSAKFILSYDYERLDVAKVSQLKQAALTTLLSLLEGKVDPSIPRHMLLTLDFSSIEYNITQIISRFEEKSKKNTIDNDDPEIQPAFSYYFLLRILSDYDKEGKLAGLVKRLATSHSDILDAGTGSIEIVRNGELERVYFGIPSVCNYLTEKSKNDLIYRVKRNTPQDKLTDFFNRSENLMQEIEHRESLAKDPSSSWLTIHEEDFNNINFVMALIINFIIITNYDAEQIGFVSSPIYWLLFILSTVQLIVSGISFVTCGLTHVLLNLR